MPDRRPPGPKLGPPFVIYTDDLGQVVRTEPEGLIYPGANMIDIVRRYKTVPVAFRDGGWVYTACEVLPADGQRSKTG